MKSSKIENSAGKKSLWEFFKFVLVSILATVIQFTTLNIMYLMPFVRHLFNTPFDWFVFHYTVAAKGAGFFIAFNVANVFTQIVAYFINRKATFKSSANIAKTLSVFMVFTVCLICFSAWLSPHIQAWLLSKNYSNRGAANLSTAVCCVTQFLISYPFNKLLFRKRKKNVPNKAEKIEKETVNK